MDKITNVPDLFGCDVFNEATMKKCLSDDIFQAWKHCVSTGSQLSLEVADKIADAMKQWAVDRGATHYTHWFQPLTGITAEKHDAFIERARNAYAVVQTGETALYGNIIIRKGVVRL